MSFELLDIAEYMFLYRSDFYFLASSDFRKWLWPFYSLGLLDNGFLEDIDLSTLSIFIFKKVGILVSFGVNSLYFCGEVNGFLYISLGICAILWDLKAKLPESLQFVFGGTLMLTTIEEIEFFANLYALQGQLW